MMRNPLSVLLTSMPLEFEGAVRQASEIGFTHVDVVALGERPASHREALAEAGMVVSCASLGRGLRDGFGLDVVSLERRRETLDVMKRQLADCAALGATHAYVVPPHEGAAEAMMRFRDGCSLLAEFAASRMIQLCVEPVPGRALTRVDATLDWLSSPGLEALKLLLDVGHCLISGEDPADSVHRAGERLGYVHLDDNDGFGDLHWPLLTGKLTPGALKRFLDALSNIGHEGVMAFELDPELPDPILNLRRGKVDMERIWQGGELRQP
jgi:sugar phosphate isomerase/epimerase